MKIIDEKYMNNYHWEGPFPEFASSYVVLEDGEVEGNIATTFAGLMDGLFNLAVSAARPPEYMDSTDDEDDFVEHLLEEYETLKEAEASKYYPYLLRAAKILYEHDPNPALGAALKEAKA